jgi:serine/threonine protein kinase
MDPTSGDPARLAGRYRLGVLLGRGGMAEVYDGFDERLARPVAIKILRTGTADDADRRERFEREARSAARLSHPAVVAVYDSGEDRGRSYLVMERLPGETLLDRMRAGPVDGRGLAGVAADVLDALVAAHALGLVHRDIKPANILLTADGRAKVADFGIAKTYGDDGGTGDADLTATGLVLGTVAYLSPEQIAGAAPSPQADIYSLGVVLYEALAGRKPFVGDNPIAQARAASEDDAPDLARLLPGVDPRLSAVVRRAMARRVEDRYPSAVAMLADLEATGLVERDAGSPDTTILLPGAASTVVLPAAGGLDATRMIPRAAPAPGPPGPGSPDRPVPADRPVPPDRPVPADRPGRRRAGLIGAVVALAVVVVAVAVVAIIVDHKSSPSTINPSTVTTPSTVPTSSVPITAAPTTPTSTVTTATTTPATASTAPATTTTPSTTTAPSTTTTTAPSTTTTTTPPPTTSGPTTPPPTTTPSGG